MDNDNQPMAQGSGGTSEWPAVPPAPTPVWPALASTPEPPGLAMLAAQQRAAQPADIDDDSPTARVLPPPPPEQAQALAPAQALAQTQPVPDPIEEMPTSITADPMMQYPAVAETVASYPSTSYQPVAYQSEPYPATYEPGYSQAYQQGSYQASAYDAYEGGYETAADPVQPVTITQTQVNPVSAVPIMPPAPKTSSRKRSRKAKTTRPPTPPEESAVLALQKSVRRQQAQARRSKDDLVWQPRFAYTSALVILIALTIVSLPLWLVLYRITNASTTNGSGPRVADLLALCMMLLGGFLAAAAAWVIIIEMRGRVRMVDTLARTGEREMVAPVAPEIPVLDAPVEHLGSVAPMATISSLSATAPIGTTPSTGSRAEVQASAAAMLDASGKLLASFSSVLKSFGQLHAQVAMLLVALALFVGATVLSLH